MIHIYYSFYKEDPTGQEKDRKREHRIGRELLCRGLKELYGPEVNPGESPGGSPGEISRYMDIEQIDGLLAEGKYGKPFLKERPDIHFNISHCSGLVVCVFADRPVGVDVETIRPVRDPLICRVLHEEELRVLSRYGQISEKKRPEDRTKDQQKSQPKSQPERSPEFLRLFFRYWTLKESYLKQDGSGLTKEPREICFYVDPDDWESPVHLSDPGMICMQQRITRLQENGEEYVLSVCVPNRCSAGETVHWEEEH